MSSLISGSTAREHFDNISKPDTVYTEGKETVYIDSYKQVSGRIQVINTTGNIEQSRARGDVIIDYVAGNIIEKKIEGIINE